MHREQIFKRSAGEKVKSEFSWLKKSLLWCALERHCLALRAEWRGKGWERQMGLNSEPKTRLPGLGVPLAAISDT